MKKVSIGILLLLILLVSLTFVPKIEKSNRSELFTIEEALINDKNYSEDKKLLCSSNNCNYEPIFDKNDIFDVYINVDDYNYNYLVNNAVKKPNVLVNSITINDMTIKYPSIKTKGNTTLGPVDSLNTKRYSYTINFKKYIKNQNLYGLNKISFNNMYGDTTLMKEYISYYLFTEMGLDTIYYSYVNLYINNDNIGPYLMIEPITNNLINRTMNEDGDFLFKPGKRGASLLYDKGLDKYIDADGTFNFDSILYDENGILNYPRSSNIPITRYNDIWEDDIKDFEKIVDELPLFFKSLKELNTLSEMENKNTSDYENRLNKIIDVDKLIRYLAVNTYLVNTDSYFSDTIINYGLYMDSKGKFTIIPWDYNMIFGADFFNNVDDVINFDIYNPVIKCNISERPLINVILGNDNLRKKYDNYLNDIIIIASKGGKTSSGKVYKQNNLNDIIDKYGNKLVAKAIVSNYSFYKEDEIKTAQSNLKKIIELRSDAVSSQINKKKSRVNGDFDIKTLGGIVAR